VTASPNWIVALLGLLGLWILSGTIRDFGKGVVRRRDGTIHSRSDQPGAFWQTVILNAVVSMIFVIVAVGVILFDWPVKK